MKKLITLILSGAMLLCAPVAAAAAEPSDNADLVTDAFTYTYADGSEYGYHVPKINLDGDGIQAVNDAMWEELYEKQLRGDGGALTAIEGGWSPEPYAMDYKWALNGNVLSIWARASYSNDYGVYSVYNISVSTGQRISDRDLLSLVGVSQASFYANVKQVLSDTFEAQFGSLPEDEFKAEQRAGNISNSNVQAARPYLDRSGALCAIDTVYSLAGAGEYSQELTIMARDQLPKPLLLSSPPEKPAIDERLQYFIDYNDTVYFTEADIEGFDAQMCLYARNSIYAKLGWDFDMPELKEFFSQFDWYAPTLDPDQFTADMINDCQAANRNLVQSYERSHGFY